MLQCVACLIGGGRAVCMAGPLLLLSFLSLSHQALSIGCFVCSSYNGSDPACEDPFNSTFELADERAKANKMTNYNYPCFAYKKGRQGLFPADHCIKINGHKAGDPSQTMVIRTCALDSGTLTADTEIVRISHCGHFKYEGVHFSGCVQSCDSDGCNTAVRLPSLSLLFLPVLAHVLRLC